MVSLRHSKVAIGDDNPDRQIGVSHWNAEHNLTGTANYLLGFDGSGNATSVAPGTVGAAPVADRTALAALSTSSPVAYLAESGREGTFVWSSANNATNVTNDPQQGVYVAPSSDTTGASGAWVRKFPGSLNAKWFGVKGDSVLNASTGTDDTAAIQAAINYINSIGGGTIYFPEGYYKVTSYLTLCANLTLQGAGRKASYIVTAMAGGGGANLQENTRNGSVLYSNWPSNSSTTAAINVRGLSVQCSNAANVGAAFYDNCGSFITIDDCWFKGQKYGIIFDQTELSDIVNSNIEPANNSGGGVWLVGSADLKSGNSSGFTNRISIKRCQVNAGATVYGIIDDGGNTHAFEDNNYNGCLRHIRAANVVGLRISGGEFESAASEPIQFAATTLAGTVTGSCSAVWVGGGAELVPAAGQSCVLAISLGNIVLDSVFFGNSTAVKFNGANNTNQIIALNCYNGGGGATFNARATNHFEVGYDGTSVGVRTNLPMSWAGTTIVNASGVLQAAGFPALTGDVTNSAGSLSTTVGKINGVALSGLATGILKNTTGTGVPSIAVAGDFPTLNQNTTGSAATLTTSRNFSITGKAAASAVGFNGSGDVTLNVTALTVDGAITPSSVASTGAVTSSSASAGIGYATGAGGTVTQLTNKSTGVTLNKVCGQITTNNAALAANTGVSFTVTNSAVAATDTIDLCLASGNATAGTYNYQVDKVSAGSFVIWFKNISAGSLSEALVFSFSVNKAVTA